MSKQLPRFIILDDDVAGLFVGRKIISTSLSEADVRTFSDPSEGMEFIRSEYPGNNSSGYAILFLDIYMPGMNGWEFLEQFEELDGEIKSRIRIIIFSHSMDERDKERALKNKNVSQYIVKPLTKEFISKMFPS